MKLLVVILQAGIVSAHEEKKRQKAFAWVGERF